MVSLSVSDRPIYDSSRSQRRVIDDAIELFRYRDLLSSLIQRDLTVRYKRSALGFLWTMLNPLLMMLVLTVVFSYAFRFPTDEHYAIYVLSGLLVWFFFSQSSTQAMHNIVWGGGLLNKIYVPKAIFILSAVFVGLVNLILSLGPLALIMLVTGQSFSAALFFLPIPILLTMLFAMGVGLFFSALAVFFADVLDIYQFGLSVLMYLTPLIYPVSIIPDRYRPLLQLNPLYYFVEIFRAPIYQGQLPEPYLILRAGILALVALVIGWWFFVSKSDEFAYRT